MAEKMMAYLQAQPQIWREILENFKPEQYNLKAFGNKPRNIIMIGSGSSYNASCCVQQLYADLLGIRVIPCEPTRLNNLLFLYSPDDTVLFFISQSGESTSTISAMKHAKERGFRILSITQALNSSVANMADGVVELACGEETVGPKTKGFSVTVLTLQLIALAQAENTENISKIKNELYTAALEAGTVISDSIPWVNQISPLLSEAPHIILLAENSNRPAMLEGALKILETLYIPCISYEFEEYLHGVQCTIAPGSFLILVVPDNENRERMLRLADFNTQHGGISFIISTGKPTNAANELFLSVSGSSYTACYNVLIPMQLISAIVSADKGINCDRSKFPEFIHFLGTKNY